MQFRKKPVVIEAEQFSGNCPLPFSSDRICNFANGKWFIDTLEGRMQFTEGDWIIKGVKGEFYPCKPDIFAATYEKVEVFAKTIVDWANAEAAMMAEESAWVIEHEDSKPGMPEYFTGKLTPALRWSNPNCHVDACRFARKQDAARMAIAIDPARKHSVVEHTWTIG